VTTPAAALAHAYLLRLSERLAQPLRVALRNAAVTITPAQMNRMLQALAANDIERAVDVVWNDPAVRAAWARVAETYGTATIASAAANTRVLRVTLNVRLAAPVVNHTLLTAVRRWEDVTFAPLKKTVRDGMRDVLASTLADGAGPRAAVAALRDSAGRGLFTAYDGAVVRSFRKSLTADPARALRRTLRDKRFDGLLQRRATLSAEQVARMTAAYQRKLGAWRAETFARTAALQAANDGQAAAWRSAIESGSVAYEEVRRYWIVAADERLCPQCAPIPDMNPAGVGLEELFDTPIGALHGPVVHANCRCTTWTRVERSGFAPRPTPGILRSRAARAEA